MSLDNLRVMHQAAYVFIKMSSNFLHLRRNIILRRLWVFDHRRIMAVPSSKTEASWVSVNVPEEDSGEYGVTLRLPLEF